MDQDETVAVEVLLGMKQAVVPANHYVQTNTGWFHEHVVLGSVPVTVPNANSSTKSSKHSNAKHANDKRSRSGLSLSELSHNSAAVEAKSAIRAKKPKLISPVSIMDTSRDRLQHSSNGMTHTASASLLPMLSDKIESSTDRTLMSVLSPKTASHTLQSAVTLSTVASHQDALVGVTEPALSHFNTPFWCQQVQEHQNSQLSTQNIVSALLVAEIQKMTALVNAQQKELQSANHVRDYIATTLFNQAPIPLGPTSSLQSMQSLLQCDVPISGENWAPVSVSSPWADSKGNIAAGHGNDCHTNHVDGVTNALLLNLIQQAITSSSVV